MIIAHTKIKMVILDMIHLTAMDLNIPIIIIEYINTENTDIQKRDVTLQQRVRNIMVYRIIVKNWKPYVGLGIM